MQWKNINKSLKGKSGIYKLELGGHIYVGSSKNLYNRLLEHKMDLNLNQHKNDFLQNVSNKYGLNNFNIEILEECDPEIRLNREAYYIEKLHADMNLQDPLTHNLSNYSKNKLKKHFSNKQVKIDKYPIECYDYFGDYITTFKNKSEAAEKLNMSYEYITKLVGGYKKGVTRRGIRLRCSNSKVPVQHFIPNPQYLGRHYDFYYKDENNEEKLAFQDIKQIYSFLTKQLMLKKKEITIIPKLKTL